MDSFFGIGIPELIVILLLAGLIMGPQRIRQVAHTLGRITAQLQRVSREFTRQLNAELDALDDGSLRNTMDDVRQLQKEVDELRRELANAPKSLQGAGKRLTEETEAALKDTETADEITSPAGGTLPSDDLTPTDEPSLTDVPSLTDEPSPADDPSSADDTSTSVVSSDDAAVAPAGQTSDGDAPADAAPKPVRPPLPKAIDVPGDPD
ncbi:MAG: twin-arginine translocase TatA/TatE family subunit [Chloroflexota bacterium]|nr:MAG: twin-arginine translocase TatA/TatE family subunit [Chloroflexota bacterium]